MGTVFGQLLEPLNIHLFLQHGNFLIGIFETLHFFFKISCLCFCHTQHAKFPNMMENTYK
jgi:hypothetical protein